MCRERVGRIPAHPTTARRRHKTRPRNTQPPPAKWQPNVQVAAAQQLADLRFGIVELEGVQPLSVARAHLQAEVLAQHVQQERAQLRSSATWSKWQRAHKQFSEFLYAYSGSTDAGWDTCTLKTCSCTSTASCRSSTPGGTATGQPRRP